MSDPFKEFLERAESVGYFENVGAALEGSVPRIAAWDEWPDPEGGLVAPIHFRQQALHDQLVDNDEEVQEYWNTLIEFVLSRAKSSVPWVDGEDSWYAPNTAAWHAAWTFALYSFCLIKEVEVPREIRLQWEWFEKGHWPCAVHEYEGEAPVSFIVF